MEYEQTRDLQLVRKCLTHPRIYRCLTDDYSPAAEEFQPVADPRMVYVLVFDRAELLGVILFLPQSPCCYEMHLGLLPESWGRATDACRGSLAWLFTTHREAARIVASVPRFNRLTIAGARRIGMREYGVNPRSFLKFGELHDQILLGISRGEVCRQQ